MKSQATSLRSAPAGADPVAASKTPAHRLIPLAVLSLCVCAAVVFTHWPALSSTALVFDDQQYIVENELVQNPSWLSGWRFLSEVYEPSTVQGYYQPLTMISLMLDWAAGGRIDNLRPFHRTNLVLHVFNTLLVILLVYSTFGEPWTAGMLGLLFGVHPLTVEPVAWVGDRKTLLAAFFSLLCLLSYLRFARRGERHVYVICALTYVLALMSKPTSTPLPALMLILDYWPLRRLSKAAVKEKLPLFVIGAAFAVITIVSQGRTAAVHLPGEDSAARIPLILCHNVVFYLSKIAWPRNLSQHYPFPEPLAASHPAVLAGVIGTALVLTLALLSLRRTRTVLAGFAFFFVAILPTMGVIGFTMVIAADKYAYLPSIGILLMLASAFRWAWQNPGRGQRLTRVRGGLLVLVVLLAGAEISTSRRQLVHWRGTESLYRRMLTLAPQSAVVNADFGAALFGQGKAEEALAHYNRAIELSPHYAEAYYNRGFAHAEQGDYAQAVADFTRAIELRPEDAVAVNNRGNVHLLRGDLDHAIDDYTAAIRMRPGYAEAYNNRGFAHGRNGNVELAIQDFTRAIELKPDYASAYNNRAVGCLSLKRYEQAWADVKKCRSLGGVPEPAVVAALEAATKGNE